MLAVSIGIHQFHAAVAVLPAYPVHAAAYDEARFVYQGDVVAEFLDGLHVVGRQHYRGALVAQAQYLLAYNLDVDGVEARERLVENHQRRPVHDGGYELHLLRHTLRQLLHLLVPPRLDAEAHEPFLEGLAGFGRTHALELRKVHGLLAYLHLAVQSALLRHISYPLDILLGNGRPLEQHLARIRDRYPVYYTDQSGLARPVGPEQTEYPAFRNLEVDVLQRNLLSEMLGYVFTIDY